MKKWIFILLAVVIWLVGNETPVLFPDANMVTIMDNTLTVFKGQDALASVSIGAYPAKAPPVPAWRNRG